MTKEERYKTIMDMLLKHGSVLVSDLSEMLEVSAVTIRKDLTELEKAGKLYRSHGKAIIVNPFTNNRTVNEKEKLAPEEKYAIGREAAKLITYNDSIILASGTTIHAFAQCIKPCHCVLENVGHIHLAIHKLAIEVYKPYIHRVATNIHANKIAGIGIQPIEMRVATSTRFKFPIGVEKSYLAHILHQFCHRWYTQIEHLGKVSEGRIAIVYIVGNNSFFEN